MSDLPDLMRRLGAAMDDSATTGDEVEDRSARRRAQAWRDMAAALDNAPEATDVQH